VVLSKMQQESSSHLLVADTSTPIRFLPSRLTGGSVMRRGCTWFECPVWDLTKSHPVGTVHSWLGGHAWLGEAGWAYRLGCQVVRSVARWSLVSEPGWPFVY
jgi:hypothetical protein